MKTTHILLVFAAVSLLNVSCSEKKQTTEIIAPKPVEKAPATPVKMQSYENNENVEWLGKTYKVVVNRSVDMDMPMIEDETGNKYHDNRIILKVFRPDGTEFFSREFTKNDFSGYIDAAYLKRSALLGLVLEKADGDNLQLAASVGSPDMLSDDYVPMILTLSRMGKLVIKKDNRIDASDVPDEEDGV